MGDRDNFGRPVVATAKQSIESPQSVIAYARNNLNFEPGFHYEPAKVLTRTENILRTEDEDESKANYFSQTQTRKKTNQECGYFSVITEPYKCLGDIVLNAKVLTLSQLLPDWEPSTVVYHTKRIRKPKQKKVEEEDESKLVLTRSGQEIRTSTLRHLAHVNNGGLNPIKAYIDETRRRIFAVRGKKDYEEYLRRTDEAKAREEELKSRQSPRLVMKQLSKLDTQARAQASLLASVESHHDPEVRSRNTQAIIEKLANIYDILCSMHNMRPKDLKTRVPLKHKVLKTLCLEPISTAKDSTRSHLGRLRSHIPHSSIDTVTPMKTGLSSSSTRRHNLSKVGTRGRRLSAWNPLALEQAPKIETWEDLVCGVEERERKKSSWEPAHEGLRKKIFINAHESAKKSLDLDNTTAGRRAPLWQTVHAQERACFNVISTPRTAESECSTMSNSKADTLVDDAKAKLLKIKYQKNNDVVRYLDMLGREKMRDFHRKFTALGEISPTFEQQMANMACLARPTMVPVVDKEDESELSSWYKTLVKACSTLPPKDALDENLKKLAKFAKEDIRHMPHMKDYLCLLLMSYPAVQLVNVAVHQAFQFVWTEILGGRIELYLFWMQQRHIPIQAAGTNPRRLTALHIMRSPTPTTSKPPEV